MTSQRRLTRVPLKLEVEYRSRGNFLMSYSTNLSKGGLFLQTQSPLPAGSSLRLLLHVPGIEEPLGVDAVVAWARLEATSDGHPPGMGIEFSTLEEPYGEVIDRIVRGFSGIRIVIHGNSGQAHAVIVHYLHSICACDVVDAPMGGAVPNTEHTDLVIAVLPSPAAEKLRSLRALKETFEAPIIALCEADQSEQEAKAAGADQVLLLPPAFGDLQAAVIGMLARPSRVK